MNTFIRTSDVSDINNIRQTLWRDIYSDLSNTNCLAIHIRNNLVDTIDRIEFDFTDMSINLKTGEGKCFDIENCRIQINAAFKEFIKDMYVKGLIRNDKYLSYLTMSDSLFSITFCDSMNIKISL